MPYNSDPIAREKINFGKMEYFDFHLGSVAQYVRCGFFGDLDTRDHRGDRRSPRTASSSLLHVGREQPGLHRTGSRVRIVVIPRGHSY